MKIKISSIMIGNRLDSTKEENIASLIESIKEVGLLTPITITEEHKLIAGFHRLEAFKRLGKTEIEANVVNLNETEALLAEIDENIKRKVYTALEESRALAKRKELYEILHPETKHGKNTKESRQNGDSDMPKRFTQDTASAVGQSERTIQRKAEIGNAFTDDDVEKLKETKVAKNQSELQKIAKLEPQEKHEVIEKISAGEAKSVKEAKKQIEIQERVEKVSEVKTTVNIPIYLGSAPDVLKTLPKNSVDMVLTDPPYGVNYQDSRQSFNPDYKDDSDYALQLLDDTCKELKRVIKDDAHLYFFCGCVNAFEFKQILSKYFDVQDNWITWVKNNHTICDFDKRYASKYEIIWFCTNKKRSLNYKLSPDVLSFDIPKNKKHKAQKPNDLLEYLIKNSTVEGETVLDCYAGSGSTLRAAKDTNRKFIGIEYEPEIHAIAVESVS